MNDPFEGMWEEREAEDSTIRRNHSLLRTAVSNATEKRRSKVRTLNLQGLGRKQIARKLKLKLKTVDNDLYYIRKK